MVNSNNATNRFRTLTASDSLYLRYFIPIKHDSKLKQIDLNCKVRLRTKEHLYIYEDDHVGGDESEDDFGAQLGMDDRLDEGESDEEATNGEGKESGIEDDGSADDELDEEEDDDEEEEDKIFVMHSVQNERRDHMVTQSLPKCIKFPVAFKPSLEKVRLSFWFIR